MLKKIYKTGVAHPAVFSDVLMPIIAGSLKDTHREVLDPFAGVGKVHELRDLVDWEMHTVGIEIEPEWATIHPDTFIGDAHDSHDAKDGSVRRSYTHDIGRKLHANNSGHMQWGDKYREFHEQAWAEIVRVLDDRLVLNISDHIRNGERQYVSMWHTNVLANLGLTLRQQTPVQTRRMKAGANSQQRVDHELVMVFDR